MLEPSPGRPHSLVEVGLLGHLLTPLQGIGVLVLQALQVRHGPHTLNLQPLVVRIQPVVGPGPDSEQHREHTDKECPSPQTPRPRSLQPSDSQILVSSAPRPPACLFSSDVLATSRPTESESPGRRDPQLPVLLHGPRELRKYHSTVSRRPCDRSAHAVGPLKTCDKVSSLFRPVILYLGYT